MQTNPSTVPTKKIKKFGIEAVTDTVIFRFHSIHKYDVTLKKDNIFFTIIFDQLFSIGTHSAPT